MAADQRDLVRAGDTAAFEALFAQYARSIYNLAFRLTGSWSTAEDVVSLTFLEAWRLRGSVHVQGGSLQPWLLGITVNVARNVTRAARRHQAAMSRLPPPAAVPDFAEDLAGRLDDEARLAVVRTAVAGLRRREQEVLALCVWSGLDYATAAKTLGVPVGTVRSRLSRARSRLQKLATAAAGQPGPGSAGPPVDTSQPPDRSKPEARTAEEGHRR